MTTNNTYDFAAFKKAVLWTVPLVVLYELVSYAGFVWPSLLTPAFLLIVALTGWLALTRFHLAVLVVLAELCIGSQGGYMVTFGSEWGLEMSMRHGLFLLVVGVWFAELVASSIAGGERRRAAWEWWRTLSASKLLWPFIALIACILMGVARGLLLGRNETNLVFFDAIRSFYYGLFPAILVAFAVPKTPERAAGVVVGTMIVSIFKALVVEFAFSHRIYWFAKQVYIWVRDTRVGEVTIHLADFHRVFFQSWLFVLVSMFTAALIFALAPRWKARGPLLAAAYFAWCMVSMLLSLSRSFWFGGAVAVLCLGAAFIWARVKWQAYVRVAALGVASVLIGASVIGVVYAFPWPNKSGDVSLADIFGSRALSLNDDAAKSRWALLPKLNEAAMRHPILGSGYGTTVTYQSSDPRIVKSTGGLGYTTYAFEWGYHDIWLKIGLVGVAVYGWFLFALLRPLVRGVRSLRGAHESLAVPLGVLLGVVALLATHLFSPYLNHALGIGVLMVVGAWAARGFTAAKPTA